MRKSHSAEGPIRLRSKGRKNIVAFLVRVQGNSCVYCTRLFEGDALRLRTLDHLIPLSRGGSHHISNLALSCVKCNNAKANMTFWEYIATDEYEKRRAWGVRQRETPRKVKLKVEVLTTLAWS